MCVQTEKPVLNSGGSGSDFFGFGLKLLLGFRVRVDRVLSAYQLTGLTGFGFNASNI